MKNGYKLYYGLLSFRWYVFFFNIEREYIADTLNFRCRSFKLIVEKPTLNPEKLNPKYSYLSIRTKVNININQWELKVESDNLL